MGHLALKRDRFSATPAAWLPFGQQVGTLCNEWSGRSDVVAFVGEGAGGGAAACWVPSLAEMEVDVSKVFDKVKMKPEFLEDFTLRSTHFEHPAAAGAIMHESMHAKHTRWDLEEAFGKLRQKIDTFAISHLIEWFEESRIEYLGCLAMPRNRSFLRASGLKLALGDMKEIEEELEHAPIMQMSKLILLSLARVDAGSLKNRDVRKIRKIAVDQLGEKLLGQLRELWIDVQKHGDDYTFDVHKKNAEKWVELLKEAGHDPTPKVVTISMPGAGGSSDGEPQPQDGDGDSDGDGDAMADAVAAGTEELEDAADQAEVAGTVDAGEQAYEEHVEEEAKKSAAAAKEAADARETASKVFGASTAETGDSRTRSRVVSERDPKPAEVAAAVIIARELEQARYRDRYITKTRSELPPGRLSGRGAMLRDVQRQRGVRATAEPFAVKRRHVVEDPNLTVGIMTDISGSMNPAMEAMAVATWLMADAGYRIQAKVASVCYGNSVFPVLKPEQHPKKVRVYHAGDSVERFDRAFKALNGKLDLLNGTGARLLVVVSDMIYSGSEVEAVKHWIKRCNESGVAVMSLPVTRDGAVKSATKGLDITIVDGAMDPVRVATNIGRAAAQELTKIGDRLRE